MARVGRPRIGERVSVRFDDATLTELDARAATAGMNRAEAIRLLVASGLASQRNDGVDRTQIAHRLALSPAQRLHRMAEETRRMLALTGRVS